MFTSYEPAFESLYSSPQTKLAGVKDLIRGMDEDEVQRAVVFGFPWEHAEHYKRHNDYIIESTQQYPERLTGFCCFSPLSSGATGEVERCLNQGLSGVGELAVYNSGLTSEVVKALEDVMAVCSQRDLPFLLHTNEPVGHIYPGKTSNTLLQIYDFIKAYPQNRIVLAHWGGGLLFYGLMKREMKEAFQNVWFDTAASPFLYIPDIYRIAGEIVGYDKILFGSDYPLLRPKRYFNEMDSAEISSSHMEQITGLNAAGLLGL